ncbi:MAG: TonB-dependent receptor [Sphingomonadales bacterium 35-56-22]|jgi:iron complex outermembrane receptor protein|uniref:TonB-dependent receptor n=1 Tax=Sphingorhabdus sp. TaxID=1902408 RepID=UPI000BDCABCA|nr:TonB-dependent receptor [Sphingorhabdus sp.]OYY15007.1 MAG: TonB-dependent receptor [Sphingomonadales bacterium 35-56-22]OYY96618.1 MAG: TonB-dependent receptor [Sphingomonadales bacterium 28-56-43]OYZ59978.1 MAG: TonB-dependent receptor [Sphingomonadales bacterium 24-56-14]OZA82153.1 MAG: TonB-dependent receptor [Sphingomonadales bacterium 39-57-19]HQS13360.1 TonB-dependent receptor [Sphingorhabdus sp.]
MKSTKISMIRAALLASIAVSGVAVTAPVMAQDEAASAESGDEIIVTARRREENLLDVPIAVSAFSGEALELRGALDLTDIGNITPNTTLETSRGSNSTLSAFIRGIGQQDPVSGFEPGVGIYLDDVYLNRPQAAVLDIYEVERIEVLRGPQGTLYGRNTIGGAVKYVTKRLPQEFALSARATVGTYDQADGVLTVSAPIGDIVRVGGSVARLSRGGFGDNLTTGLENYNKDVWAARGTLELGGYGAPVSVRISGDYSRDKSDPRGGHRIIPGLLSGAPVLDNVFDTRGGLVDPKQDIEAYGLAMNISVDLSDTLTLRSISAWRKDDTLTPIDFDALPAADVDVPGGYFNEQVSQEVQLLVDAGPFSGMVGAYYLDATADTLFDVRLFTTLSGLTAFTNAAVDTETYAVFGDFTYDLSDQLSLSVGGRYTWDKRTANILRQNYLGGGSPFFGGAGVAFGAASTNFSGQRDFKKFTPRVSLSFKPTPDDNIYASFSQGFKGGGFDPRGVGANAPDLNGNGIRGENDEVAAFLSFRPESVDSYEVGYKGNAFDGGLTFALAGFYADYTDVQIPGSVACIVSGLPSFCGVTSNAGKATFKGVELEFNARLGESVANDGDRLNLLGAVGYIDAKFDQYISNIASVPTDVAAFRDVQNTPSWTASATLAYMTPVGAGRLNVGTTVSYRSSTTQFEIPNPYIDQSGYALVDASLVYTAPDDRWSIGLYGKNLFDKEYKTSGYSFIAGNATTGAPILGGNGLPVASLGREGTLTAFYGNPRQVFLTAGVKF